METVMEARGPHSILNRRLSTMASAVAGEWYAWLLNRVVTTVRSPSSPKDAATRQRSLKPPPSTEALKIRNSSRSPRGQWQSQQHRLPVPVAHALGSSEGLEGLWKGQTTFHMHRHCPRAIPPSIYTACSGFASYSAVKWGHR